MDLTHYSRQNILLLFLDSFIPLYLPPDKEDAERLCFSRSDRSNQQKYMAKIKNNMVLKMVAIKILFELITSCVTDHTRVFL